MSDTQNMTKEQGHAYLAAVSALYAIWAMLEPGSPAQMRALAALDNVREIPRNLGP